MGDKAIVKDDAFTFEATSGARTLAAPLDGKMVAIGGMGKVKIQGKEVCVDGDEKLVIPITPQYKTPPFTAAPGAGLGTIAALGGDQKAKKVKVNSKAVILKGSTFQAKFMGTAPAMKPVPPPPPNDLTFAAPSMGTGTFTATETKVTIT